MIFYKSWCWVFYWETQTTDCEELGGLEVSGWLSPDSWPTGPRLGGGIRAGVLEKLWSLCFWDGPLRKGLWSCTSLQTSLGFVCVLFPPTEVSVTNWLPYLTKYVFSPTYDYTGKYMQSGKDQAVSSHVSLCVMGPGRAKMEFSFPFMWALGTRFYRCWDPDLEQNSTASQTPMEYAFHGNSHTHPLSRASFPLQ